MPCCDYASELLQIMCESKTSRLPSWAGRAIFGCAFEANARLGWAASAVLLEITVRLGRFGHAFEITGRPAALLRTLLRVASLAP